MKVLFLDDNTERILKIIKEPNESLIYIFALDAGTAINFLKNYDFDFISLDHDLDDKVYQNSNEENCGMRVVDWLCENRITVTAIRVHSWNVPAGQEMVRRLNDAGYSAFYRPFGE